MELLVFADERKKLLGRWDYIALGIVPKHLFHDLLQELRLSRARHRYDGEFKFAELNAKGTGTKLEVAKDWVDLIYRECDKKPKRFFFKVMGIDREKISFRFFGDGDTEHGKYSNLYNRYFRTTLLGALNFFFPNPEGLTIAGIYHDTEGNLQTHDYFKLARHRKDRQNGEADRVPVRQG